MSQMQHQLLTLFRNKGASLSFDAAVRLLAPYSPRLAYNFLDPTNSLFQGTTLTPVTAVTNPVGVVIDQTQGGLTNLGSDLASGLNFTTWSGANVSSKSGLTFTTTAGGGVFQSGFVTAGRTYRIRITGTITDGRTLFVRNSSNTTGQVSTSSASFSLDIASPLMHATESSLYFSVSGACTVTFTSVSVQLIPGNHATASSDAKRPLFARRPATGRRNLLEYTEAFNNAYWTKTTSTVVSGAEDPTGGSTAWTLTSTAPSGLVLRLFSGLSGSVTNSIWIRRRTGTGVIRFYTGSASSTQQMQSVVTSSWQRLSTATATATGTTDRFGVILETSGDAVDIWQPQFETGSTATNYQRVVTSADITEAGVRDVYQALFDGSDDCLQVSGFDLSNTDKVCVIAGVRKLSDAGGGVIVEHSADVNSNNGSFGIFAPTGVAANSVNSAYRGTSFVANATANSFTSPISGIIASVFDIAGPLNRQIINGASINTVTTSAGTGNFANNTLNIGGRNNSASLPFNGAISYLFVLGAIPPDDVLTRIYRGLAPQIGVSV